MLETVRDRFTADGEHTSTWSADQLSILKLFTFEICVPSFRCRAAQRIQRNIPNCPIREYQQLIEDMHIYRTDDGRKM